MDSTDPIKTGHLYSLSYTTDKKEKTEWKQRYYVLYPYSDTNKARLDWFPDEASFQSNPNVRKTIFIEEVNKVKSATVEGRQHGFQINTLRRKEPFTFSASSRRECKIWVDHLVKLLEDRKKQKSKKNPHGGDSNVGDDVYCNELWAFDEDPSEYDVLVGETAPATACKINKQDLILQVFSNCIRLQKGKPRETLFIWPYKYIRRYGRSKTSFTFEAGRRCASGEGVFILMSPDSEAIFEDVQKGNNNDPDGVKDPDLPSRSYGNHYGKLVADMDQKAGSKPPPLPSGSRPLRDRKPLPATVMSNYVDPMKCDDEDQYSSIEEETARGMMKNIPSLADGYTNPTNDISSMSALAAQIRLNQNKSSNEEYDEVRLDARRLQSNQLLNDQSNVLYGQLYDSMSTRKVPSTPSKNEYDDVRTT